MPLLFLIPLILGIVGTVAGIATSAGTAAVNQQNQNAAHDANLRMTQMTNQSNVEQANLAYQRSLPINQVQNLMDAGMSRAGALSKLTGGGTYSAPALQSAHVDAVQHDFSGMAQAFDKLSSIPGNVEQLNLQEAQLNALNIATKLKQEEALRQKEIHEYEMFQRLHGKKVTESLDNLTSKAINYAFDNGISLDNIDSPQKMVELLNLKDDPIWRDMPAAARKQMFDSIRIQAQENRSNQQQKNANQAAKDAHTLALDTLKNSEFGRTLTSKQLDKIDKDLEEAQQRIDAFNDASDARTKENAARAAEADFRKLMANFGIAEKELNSQSFWTKDENGNIIPKGIGNTKSQISNAWKMVGTFFGVDLLQDIVRGIVAISPK